MLKQICKCSQCGNILYQGKENGKYYLDCDENEPLRPTINKGWGYVIPNLKHPTIRFTICPNCRITYTDYKVKDLFK